MLKVVTGSFHPHLESAFVEHLQLAKAGDPFVPVAVLVPSAPLLERLKRLLTLDRQLSFLNVHFLTFHQLALRLVDEMTGDTARPAPVHVVDDLFFEQLVRHLVKTRLSGLTALQQVGHSSGTWGALWSSIRDLKDAGVDPAEARRGVTEGCFDEDDREWLLALFSLYAAVQDVGRALNVGTADDLAQSLLPFVPASPFIRSLRHVFYYGFYDLTQIQLSLFETVTAAAPATLFFPLEGERSFTFARRFFERHIQRQVTSPESVMTPGDSPQREVGSPVLSVRSAIGLDQELAATCRTILELVETNGYRFDEIGVVARTLDPYRLHLHAVFDRHRIPFTTTTARPLIHEPLCKALLQLASLPTNDFYRATMLDLVTSPLFVTSLNHDRSPFYRPEQWKLLVPSLQITRGREEWARLKQAGQWSSGPDGEADEETGLPLPLDIAPDVVELLWHVVATLIDGCAVLPQRGTIGHMLEAFQPLALRHLRRLDGGQAGAPDRGTARLQAAWDAIERTWASLAELEPIAETLTWIEFVELLTHAFERTTLVLDQPAPAGVMVLDAMAARGLSFKALFVLGLNDKMFPRYIREDAFLRDRHRRVLDATLGFKIDEKLAGYDEESLLFALLRRAAGSRLYLSHQRADDAGRTLAPSPYLWDIARLSGLDAQATDMIPRRLTDLIAQRPAIRQTLPPADLARWMAMNGENPADLLQSVQGEADLLRHAVEALGHIEDDHAALAAYDGITGPLTSHWSRSMQRGLAPTPLERYARCPFQYFSVDVLKLDPVRVPASQEPDAALLGTLCHGALRRCYEALLAAGWPANALSDDAVNGAAVTAVEQAAAECAVHQRTGHYLLWELAKAATIDLITAAVVSDSDRLAAEGFAPFAFEVEAEGTLRIESGGEGVPMKFHGRVDRIDRHNASGALRIIDYKFKSNSAMKTDDRHLLQSAIRGSRLQPPLYTSLDLPAGGKADAVQFFFLAPAWESPIARSTFNASDWSSETGTLIHRTLAGLIDGMKRGRYFILPGTHCTTCPYRVLCRREHASTWWRAHRAGEQKQLAALRKMTVKKVTDVR
ncbi:conserved protein of unknown function [Nitrospira japonica]|uniref:PD-(D/E)XK endonuclease-like domain-containing protein n=1 Tax=Nitrospira japonica TaxID=1325564 RepID=A0A1W1I931_9BACT|nr:PD-(D/E)XK nuclease family protein [Nitrospira japonica]SLM49524.1 conserved protein of unknown function [Nitrospira japonica]